MKNYTQQFEKTVLRFCQNGQLLTPHIVVAVSGGLDSMSLALFASQLLKKGQIKKLTFIHINHQTRKDCGLEEKLVKDFAKKRRACFKSFKVQGLNLNDSSFEQKAREARKEIFKQVSRQHKVKIWCAHHIDDSFEWSLKQRLSSSVYRRQYGIPYKTPLVVRPFMSVTRSQIERYALSSKVKWREDKSNSDHRFERGYLRKFIIPAIKKKYPQYLKHYVGQMQLENSYFQVKKREHFHSFLCWPSFAPPLQQIQKSIQSFSKKRRGKLADQLRRIEKMLASGKSGPMDMSGGVKIYNLSHELVITHSEQVVSFMKGSFELGESKVYNYDNIQEIMHSIKTSSTLSSIWLALDDANQIEDYKGGHPLLPMNLRACARDNGKYIVSSWKVLRHLIQNKAKKIKITSIVQID